MDFGRLFPDMDVTVQASGTVAWASSFIEKDEKNDPNLVLVHLGTNDLKSMDPNEFVSALSDLKGKMEARYQCPVIVSSILPRKDRAHWKVNETNLRLVDFGFEPIIHTNISTNEIHDLVHLDKFAEEGYLSGTQIFAKNLYRGVYNRDAPPARLPQAVRRNPPKSDTRHR